MGFFKKKPQEKISKKDSVAEAAEKYYTRNFSIERMMVRKLVRSNSFSAFIYCVIAINTLLIAFDDISATRNNTHWIVPVQFYSDWIILAIFTFEMILKIIGLGFGYKPPPEEEIDPEIAGYFAGSWNRLDSFIVLMSWVLIPVSMFSGAGVDKLVRILRLTRPLRALREIKNLKSINELVATIPMALTSFVDVTGFLIFMLLVFSILALNLWGLEGKLHGRCVVARTNRTVSIGVNGQLAVPRTLCSEGGYACADGFVCSCAPSVYEDGTIEQKPFSYTDPFIGDPGCLIQGTPRPWSEGFRTDAPSCPDFGLTCFNNFGIAIFTCFKAITLESWSSIMWYTQDIYNSTVCWIFWTLLISFVSFNVMNLYVASMSNAYATVKENNRVAEKMEKIEEHMKEVFKARKKAERHKKKNRNKKGDDSSSSEEGGDEDEDEEEDAMEEDAKNGKQTWAEKLVDPQTYWMEFQAPDHPLNGASMFLRRVTSYPGRIDECGVEVPAVIIRMAKSRNLSVMFGPRPGQFSIKAKETAVRNVLDVHGMHATETYRQGQSIVPIEPASFATPPHRPELKELLLQFRPHVDPKTGIEMVRLRNTAEDQNEVVPYLDMFILLCILINCASSCMEHFEGTAIEVNVNEPASKNCCNAQCTVVSETDCPRSLLKMDDQWYLFMYYIELIFNLIFTLEVFFKILSWASFSRYISHKYPSNLMDFVIVMVSDGFFILEFVASGLFNPSILRLVRMTRAVRAFKTAASMKRLKLILDKAEIALSTVVYVFAILIIWHVAMTLFGMQLFQCPVTDPNYCREEGGVCPEHCSEYLGNPPKCMFSYDELYEHCPWDSRRNINTFPRGLMLLFFVTTGDLSWTDTMHRGMRSSDSAIAGAAFFLIFYMVSVYCISNLFISVILSAYELPDNQKEQFQIDVYREVSVTHLIKLKMKEWKRSGAKEDIDKWQVAIEAEKKFQDPEFMENLHVDEGSDEEEDEEENYEVLGCLGAPTPSYAHPDKTANFRHFIRAFARSWAWNQLVLCAIFASAILLATSSRIRSKTWVSEDKIALADFAFYGIFMLEFVLKVLDNGIALEGPQAYFRNAWNWLDFVLLISQTLDFIGVDGMKALRVLRVLRPLRSLRILNKIESLQKLILAVANAVPEIANILFIWLFAFIIFGIIGMTLFSGTFYQCSDEKFVGFPLNPGEPSGSKIGWRENCVGAHVAFTSDVNGLIDTERFYTSLSKPTGILRPRVWSNPPHAPSEVSFSFDNFGMTLQTLYEVSTLRGWSQYVYVAIDATQIGQHPIPGNNAAMIFYFVVWVLVSSFFIIQIVIAALIDSINTQTGTALYTSSQRQFYYLKKKMVRASMLAPIPLPDREWVKKVWLITQDTRFQNFYTGVILFNIGLMAAEHYDQDPSFDGATFALNLILLALYIFEIILKMLSCFPTFGIFFRDVGNSFDLLVVCGSIVDAILSAGGGSSGLQALRVLRVMRVLRTLRFVRRSPRLMLMVNTMVASVPGIISVLGFMMMHIFVFGILGNQFFSGLKFGTGLNRRNNFDHPFDAMLLLFVTITGDGWTEIMRDVAVAMPMCTSDEEVLKIREEHMEKYGRVFFADPQMDVGDCGGLVGSVVFFDIFYFIGFQVLRSLFIAGMMENFFAFKSSRGYFINDGHILDYKRKWMMIDPSSKGYIAFKDFRRLCNSLALADNPLGKSVVENQYKYGQARIELDQMVQRRMKRKAADEAAIIKRETSMMTRKQRERFVEERKRKQEALSKHTIPQDAALFNEVLVLLGLYTVGVMNLPYKDMKCRAAKLVWYGKLYAGSQMVAMFRGHKERKHKVAAKLGQVPSGAVAILMGDKTDGQGLDEAALMLARGKPHRRGKHPQAPISTISETVLADLAMKDLSRKIQSVKSLQERFKEESSSGTSQDGSDDDDWVNGSKHISTNGNGHANGISH